MNIVFSTHPGSHERQLKTRYRNPLFPNNRQQVSLGDLADAQAADAEELAQFEKDMVETFQTAANMGAHVGSEVILGLKEKCDALYEQACGLGGDFSAEKTHLKKFIDILMAAVVRGATGDDYALDELAQESTARDIHFRLLDAPVVTDLLKPDSPVAADELIPTLLSQSATDLELALELFDEEQRNDLYQQALELIKRLEKSATATPPDMSRKLALIRPDR